MEQDVSAAPVDYLLAAMLVLAARSLLGTPRIFEAIVLFIVFGLLVALGWARLLAPDLALAEAAIGAGLTGVLLLNALGRMESKDREAGRQPYKDSIPAGYSLRPRGWAVTALSCAALVLLLAWTGILPMPPEAAGLLPLIEADIDRSGAVNPVTAVLLNFRSYDTMLEIGVLLLALFGVWSMPAVEIDSARGPNSFGSPVLEALISLVVPMMILVSGHLLWVGVKAPGGAFQAGAVLAAAWVLLMLSGRQPPDWLRGWPLRAGQTVGLAVFLGVGAAMLIGGDLLEYPLEYAGSLILVVEGAMLISVSAILASLFSGRLQAGGERD